ncbi:hypothetical protein GGF31_000305 [Allomyces arbusculus]|nr:hypothetical protein GGF31_000305 [Allomyces arbusculus]
MQIDKLGGSVDAIVIVLRHVLSLGANTLNVLDFYLNLLVKYTQNLVAVYPHYYPSHAAEHGVSLNLTDRIEPFEAWTLGDHLAPTMNIPMNNRISEWLKEYAGHAAFCYQQLMTFLQVVSNLAEERPAHAASTTLVLVPPRLVPLIDTFLARKVAHGTTYEQDSYSALDRRAFLQRLIQCRALVSINETNSALPHTLPTVLKTNAWRVTANRPTEIPLPDALSSAEAAIATLLTAHAAVLVECITRSGEGGQPVYLLFVGHALGARQGAIILPEVLDAVSQSPCSREPPGVHRHGVD